ncbi:gamma-glutamyl-gamma-aminobutyrate hydrolase family protein [Alphaproteobacteria bacterium]|nr:gamma-glutamyl-gamma-aminobutyrate hydrolase family protein [Alphaproteobacteria bacterium]
MKKIIISQNIYNEPSRNEVGDKLDSRIIDFVYSLGFFPIPFSNYLLGEKSLDFSISKINEYFSEIIPDGLILTGGIDIGLSSKRDSTEMYLINKFEEKNKPVLGICRGMQILGLIGGGQLKSVEGHVRTKHNIKGMFGGEVNSFHNFGFYELPTDYNILAKSKDGCIEAMLQKTKRRMGLMWHPERTDKYNHQHMKILREFFQ